MTHLPESGRKAPAVQSGEAVLTSVVAQPSKQFAVVFAWICGGIHPDACHSPTYCSGTRDTQDNPHNTAITPRLAACLLLPPEDTEAILSFLRGLAVNGRAFHSDKATNENSVLRQPAGQDSWLGHSEAAAYLGVSKSSQLVEVEFRFIASLKPVHTGSAKRRRHEQPDADQSSRPILPDHRSRTRCRGTAPDYRVG